MGCRSDRFVEGRIAAIALPGTHAVTYTVLLNACRLFTGSIAIDNARLVIVDSSNSEPRTAWRPTFARGVAS